MEIKDIPLSFIERTLTARQKESIIVKYEIVKRVENREHGTQIHDLFADYEVELNNEGKNFTYDTIRKYYYSSK